MTGAFVKASGGCSAPASRSGEDALAGLGEMRLRDFGAAPDGRREAQVMIRHPQFSGLQRDLTAYVKSTQRNVSGDIRMKLLKGQAAVVGRKSPRSLYSYGLATYDEADEFDQSHAEGFIQIYGLPVKTQARLQGEG